MELLFFCPRWGSEQLSWDNFCEKVKAAGYNGVEAGVPFDAKEKNEMQQALQKHQLLLVGQYWQSFEKDFGAHQVSYQQHLENMVALKPVKIDAQTGKDYFSAEQNTQLFQIAEAFSAATYIPVVHETHRNKALFAAHVAKQYLEKIPSLRITADFSHWCTVAESYLEDQEEALAIAVERADHIHARVGHTQGPQVTDPQLPEWQEALQHHLRWWKSIRAAKKKNPAAQLTVTTEFGPAPYMQHDPVTKIPLASQWNINVWMMDFLKRALL